MISAISEFLDLQGWKNWKVSGFFLIYGENQTAPFFSKKGEFLVFIGQFTLGSR